MVLSEFQQQKQRPVDTFTKEVIESLSTIYDDLTCYTEHILYFKMRQQAGATNYWFYTNRSEYNIKYLQMIVEYFILIKA